jgi:hypothetical protein
MPAHFLKAKQGYTVRKMEKGHITLTPGISDVTFASHKDHRSRSLA